MVSLLRKEWRTRSIIFLVSLLAALAVVNVAARARWDDVSIGFWDILMVLAANLLAASLFSSEVSQGTMPFLLALPLRRTTIWMSKFLVGLLQLCVFVCVTTVATAIFFARYNPYHSLKMDWLVIALSISFPWLLVIYSSALLCSVLLDRPVTVVLAGYCVFVGVAYFVGIFTGWGAGCVWRTHGRAGTV